mgnify:CR=1 FL=1
MSFIGQSGEFETISVPAETGQRHEIVFNIAVRESDVLWCAAAQQLAGYGLEQDEIEACIGPRADVSLGDCLRTLLAPFELAGCAVQDLVVTARPDLTEALASRGLKVLMAELVQSTEASLRHMGQEDKSEAWSR